MGLVIIWDMNPSNPEIRKSGSSRCPVSLISKWYWHKISPFLFKTKRRWKYYAPWAKKYNEIFADKKTVISQTLEELYFYVKKILLLFFWGIFFHVFKVIHLVARVQSHHSDVSSEKLSFSTQKFFSVWLEENRMICFLWKL